MHGPSFIRLLARLGDADAAPPRTSWSDRLGQWLDWTHAVALATALDARAPAGSCDDGQDRSDSAARECTRVRAALADAIAADPAFADAAAATDFAPLRQRCLALQQVMEADVAHLRGRLRATLAATSAPMARLAVIDAVMERTLARHERGLLATVPVVLGAHFERLRQGADEAWFDTFRQDMRAVLLAELDVRLQPAQGLLAALRDRTAE